MVGPARAYLKQFRDVGQQCPAPERVVEWLGSEVAQAAYQGFEVFLFKPGRLPGLKRVAIGSAKGKAWYAGDIIIAALAERLRTRSDPFSDVPDDTLMIGLFQLWMPRHDTRTELAGLLARIEEEIRQRGLWERALRLFVTPQLKHRDQHVGRLHELLHSDGDADLAVALGIEWLQRFSELPAEPEAQMIDRVLRSSRRRELVDVGALRSKAILDDVRRRNWDAVQVIVDFPAAQERLSDPVDPVLLWHFVERIGRDRFSGSGPLPTTPDLVEWVVSTFRRHWPAVGHPTGGWSGDRNPWDATDYLYGLIDRLGEDTSEEAPRALEALRDMPEDGYSNRIKAVLAEHRRKRVEQIYVPPKVADIGAIVDAGPPTTASDLQAVMLENLAIAQKQLKGDDVDWYRGFYREDGRHKNEEPCRDELIKMLRAIDSTLEYIPEPHVADDKRVDIVARVDRQPILPIEIKGTWHGKLWTAADEQLNHQYVEDWRAERGIYLVLWFGTDPKMPKPPAGIAAPTTPEDLRRALIATSNAARKGFVDVVVLDLTRPTAT